MKKNEDLYSLALEESALTWELGRNTQATGGIIRIIGSLGVNNTMDIMLKASYKLLEHPWISRKSSLNLDFLICLSPMLFSSQGRPGRRNTQLLRWSS